MKSSELKTWDDLRNYLIGRMDCATNEISNTNKSFTKKQHWNSLISQCIEWKGQELPARTKDILIKRVRKDFKMLSK